MTDDLEFAYGSAEGFAVVGVLFGEVVGDFGGSVAVGCEREAFHLEVLHDGVEAASFGTDEAGFGHAHVVELEGCGIARHQPGLRSGASQVTPAGFDWIE